MKILKRGALLITHEADEKVGPDGNYGIQIRVDLRVDELPKLKDGRIASQDDHYYLLVAARDALAARIRKFDLNSTCPICGCDWRDVPQEEDELEKGTMRCGCCNNVISQRAYVPRGSHADTK